MIFSTITQNELTLSVDSYNLPTQNSNNIQLKFVQDTENFSGYTPTVAMALLDSALVSCADVLNEGGFVPLQNDGTFLVQNNILSQDGFLAVAINLTQTTGSTTENVMLGPVVYKIKANISALSPLPPDDNLWQSVVTAFVEQYLNEYTTSTVQPVLEQAQQAVTTANAASQTANEASQNVQTAYNNLGNYKVENGVIYFMKADGTYNEQGVPLTGQSTVTDALGNPILSVPFAIPKQLFVNPDFQVNQRGESSYSVQDLTPTYKYTLDMWYISSATGQAEAAGFGGQAVVNVESDDIEVTLGGDATFGQITNIAYNEYTSVTSLININGIDYAVTISTIPQSNGNTYQKIIQFGSQNIYFIVKNVSGNLEFYLQATSSSSITFTLKYWALYPGNIAYKHVKNNYDVDFLKCARYYINFYGIAIKRVAFIGHNLAYITYELPTIMNDSVQPNITETTSMLWQNDDTSQSTTTSLTNVQIEGKMGNAITVGFSGNFGNDNWRVAYCSSVGVEFNAEPTPS